MEGGVGESQKVILIKEVSIIHDIKKGVGESHTLSFDLKLGYTKSVVIQANTFTYYSYVDLMLDNESLNIAKGLDFVTNNRQQHCYLLYENTMDIADKKTWSVVIIHFLRKH